MSSKLFNDCDVLDLMMRGSWIERDIVEILIHLMDTRDQNMKARASKALNSFGRGWSLKRVYWNRGGHRTGTKKARRGSICPEQ